MDASRTLEVMQDTRYRVMLLALLIGANMLAFIDRQIISVLAQPIKLDLGLTDTQLGLLGGMAFALLNCVLSIPIARLAERRNRVVIYGTGILLWSVATMACGIATGFFALLAARVAVGVGEASQPAVTSLTADYFPPQRRVEISSILLLAVPVGAFIGSAGGGYMAEHFGWRTAFFVVGAPGLLVGLLFLLLVREPLRGHYDPPPEKGADDVPPVSAVFRRIWARKSYLHALFGSTIASGAGFGLNAFLAAYYFRKFGMGFGESAMIAGLISAIPGSMSMLLGGFLANRLSRRDAKYTALVPAIGLVVSTPLYVLALSQQNWLAVTAVLMVTGLFQYAYLPTSAGIYANTMESRMRATSGAVTVIFTSLIGSGAGPVVIGMLSDRFAGKAFGDGFREACGAAAATPECAAASASGLTTAMMVVSAFYLWAGLHFFLASRTVARDMS